MSTAEIINTLFRKFGANRIEVVEVQRWYVWVSIGSFGRFVIQESLYVQEAIDGRSAKAIWLEGVLRGMTRNDAGEVA